MTTYDWEAELTFAGVTGKFRWKEFFFKGESLGYLGFLMDNDLEAQLKDKSEVKDWLPEALMAAFRALRIAELHAETDWGQQLLPNERRLQQAMEIFERSRRGEYLGQSANSGVLSIQDLEPLLKLSAREAAEVVDVLMLEGKIGLNGTVLISPEEQAAVFEVWQKDTGHRRLRTSNSNSWSCGACGLFGKDLRSASKVPCVAQHTSSR